MIINVAEIQQKIGSAGRKAGAELAKIVQSGDILDFKDAIVSNSFIDEFVKKATAKNFKIINATQLVYTLINKSIKRRQKCIWVKL